MWRHKSSLLRGSGLGLSVAPKQRRLRRLLAAADDLFEHVMLPLIDGRSGWGSSYEERTQTLIAYVPHLSDRPIVPASLRGFPVRVVVLPPPLTEGESEEPAPCENRPDESHGESSS